MGLNYKAVLWNSQKKKYDLILWIGIVIVLLAFVSVNMVLHPTITIETLIIRATAFTAFLLLHIILLIGPLCRINRRFLPLLYNRRHLGVSMFLIALVHGVFCMIQFHSLGDISALESIFLSNKNYRAVSGFPFQTLGFFALIILLTMAATSHDFWLKNLSPRFWKSLHMLVYLAYGLIVAHVALGTLQYEDHPFYWIVLITGFIAIAGTHLYVGGKEVLSLRRQRRHLADNGYFKVGLISEIEDNRAISVFVDKENIAIFKYNGQLSAVHNVCKHQMGPLGEGKVVDGCITCPWHGYQYQPENGHSPPPFKEKVKTYQLKLIKDEIWVDPIPNDEGTFVEPVQITKP